MCSLLGCALSLIPSTVSTQKRGSQDQNFKDIAGYIGKLEASMEYMRPSVFYLFFFLKKKVYKPKVVELCVVCARPLDIASMGVGEATIKKNPESSGSCRER